MKDLNVLLSTILLIAFLGLTNLGAELEAQELPDTLQLILDEAGVETNSPPGFPALSFGGSSAALIAPNGTVTAVAFGKTNAAEDMQTTNRLGFSDASQFVLAVLTFALVEEGALNLSDNISTHINAGELTNVPGTVTVEQLLKHTSGLDNFAEASDYSSTLLFDVTRNFFATEITSLFVDEAASGAGSFKYSNTNFLVLGLVLEAANGDESLQESLDRLIGTPAGTSNLEFYTGSDPTDLAPLFDDVFGTGFPNQLNPNTSVLTGASFAGNLIATPTDMVKMIQAVANGEVINEASLNQMLTFSPISGRPSNAYGLGVEEFTLSINDTEKSFIGHIGGLNYKSLLVYSPADSCGVALSASSAVNDETVLLDIAAAFCGAWELLRDTTVSIPTLLSNAQFLLYPNPANEMILLDYELLKPAQVGIEIFNMMGQLMVSIPIAEKFTGRYLDQIEINQLPAGLYNLSLTINGQKASKQFVVK